MSKDSAAWLVLRVVGLVLLIAGAIQLYTFISNVIAYLVISSVVAEEPGTLRLVNLSWDSMIHAIWLGIAAVYFLRYGALMHKVLVNEGGL